MSYIPKYILKRVVPKDGVANLDLNKDGKADAVGVKYVNVITPVQLGNITLKELEEEFIGVFLDDEKFGLDKITIFWDGKMLTVKDLPSIGGQTLPVGGQVAFIVNKPGGIPAGPHKFGIKSQWKGTINAYEVERDVASGIKSVDELMKA